MNYDAYIRSDEGGRALIMRLTFDKLKHLEDRITRMESDMDALRQQMRSEKAVFRIHPHDLLRNNMNFE